MRRRQVLVGMAWLLLGIAATTMAGQEPTAWRAKWIWDSGPRTPRNAYVCFRKGFVLPSRAERAVVHVTADSRYLLYVNGKLVADGPARCAPTQQSYATVDIRAALRPGQNAIAALVHHYGEGTASYVPGAAGFLFQADIESAGQTVHLQADGSWGVSTCKAWLRSAPRMNSQLAFAEVFDARREVVGWRAATFDDFDWTRATVVGPAVGTTPWTSLAPRTIPQLARRNTTPVRIVGVGQSRGAVPKAAVVAQAMAKEPHATLSDCLVDAPDALLRHDGTCATVVTAPGTSAHVVLDFGREVSGVPRVAITVSKGGTLDVGYAEMLTDGRVDPTRGGVLYADRLVMRPGAQTWEPTDTRAFRYLQLSFRDLPGPVQVDSVTLDLITYPVKQVGSFRSNDALLDKIWQTGAYTCRLCMQDAFIDCPWRERAQWWGDARVTMHVNAYAFGDRLLGARGLRQIAQSQQADGRILPLYPAGGKAAPSVLPDYCAVWLLTLRDHWWLTGDDGPMRDTWQQVRKLLAWFHAKTNAHGLLDNVPEWVFIDNARVDKRGECAALNALYYGALRSAADMARHLGHVPTAKLYAKRADALRTAFNQRLWAPMSKCYADARTPKGLSTGRSVQANALAVVFGLAQGQRAEAAAAHVARLIQANPTGHASPYFMHYVLEALFRSGHADVALDATRRAWKVMLDGGATTWWEHFHPRASWCHAWSSTPTYHLPAWVVGVRPLAPGFARVLVAPSLARLTYAAATVPTPQGTIAVSAKHDERTGALTLDVRIPKGKTAEVTATIALPVGKVQNPEVRLGGKPVWTRDALTRDATKLVLGAAKTNGRIEFQVQGGTYRFTLSAAAP